MLKHSQLICSSSSSSSSSSSRSSYWTPSHLPSSCACGTCFSVEHALSCPKGGFPSLRHNEIRDLTANLLTKICSDVCVEPQLQPLSGESLNNRTANTDDHAHLDIAANGLWGGRYERTFMDVRVFNPYAHSNKQAPLRSVYRTHERTRRSVEHGTRALTALG